MKTSTMRGTAAGGTGAGAWLLAPFLALCAAALSAGPAEAQLMTVSQTIHGMDCAPCAHAVERRLGALDGDPVIELSLNRGVAELRFQAARHEATLERIRRSVRESGFSAREARVRTRGTLVAAGDGPVLRTPAGDVFVLVASPEAPAALRELAAKSEGERLTVAGIVATQPDPEGRWVLAVEDVTG